MLKKFREADGHKAVGSKVGYANKLCGARLKLETLVWAHMYDDTCISATTMQRPCLSQSPITEDRTRNYFRFERTARKPSLDAAAALASTDWLAIGFEIIDCPFPEWKFQPGDFVASFGLHAALMVGEKFRFVPISSRNLSRSCRDLRFAC